MTDELSPDLLQALRAEAYRVPVHLTASVLSDRIDADQRARRRQNRLLGAIAAAVGILVVAVSSITLPRPLTGLTGASPSPACAESPATRHGSWWWELGGPNAFFNVEPGTRLAAPANGTWLLHVRFDPDAAAGQSVSIAADLAATGEHVDGYLNGPADPGRIFHFASPAPSLPGGWYLFEIDVDAPGCWSLSARIDNRVVGSAVVDVGPAPPQPSDLPGPIDVPTPAVAGGTGFNVTGAASGCNFVGGCGYSLELEGPGRSDQVILSTVPPPGVGLDEPITSWALEMATGVLPLAPGTYTATFRSVGHSDDLPAGEPVRDIALASCSTGFDVEATTTGVVVTASFSTLSCSAKAKYIVLIDEPPYELSCGPIEPVRCQELADGAVSSVLVMYPGTHVVSLTFTANDGDYILELDNGATVHATYN